MKIHSTELIEIAQNQRANTIGGTVKDYESAFAIFIHFVETIEEIEFTIQKFWDHHTVNGFGMFLKFCTKTPTTAYNKLVYLNRMLFWLNDQPEFK